MLIHSHHFNYIAVATENYISFSPLLYMYVWHNYNHTFFYYLYVMLSLYHATYIYTYKQTLTDFQLVLITLVITGIGGVVLMIRSGLQSKSPIFVPHSEETEGYTVSLKVYYNLY